MMKPNARVAFVTMLAAAGIGGCAGSTSALNESQPIPHPSPTVFAGANATFTIEIPKAIPGGKKRRPLYVSPSTQSISISANGGTPTVANLTSSSPNCTPATESTPLTCTVSAAEPIGTDTFTLITYDQTGATGNELSMATVSATIVAGQANSVSVALNGIISSIALSLADPNPPIGEPTAIPLAVDAMDADGNIIVGPGGYSDANGNALTITLADSDSTYTSLSTTSVTQPNAGVTVNYNGGQLAEATISASTENISTVG
ncbi:MAG TPA: hypothetical protein VEJ20_03105, partial [Candidatus Eremiobacteraceae bacterium]|nr:hypothetical protein [Candidatus Eremiobacteraceae bacterium]